MPKHNKPHLHTYLDRENIFDIYKLWNDGKTEAEIMKIYDFSMPSLNRILNVAEWTKHQKRHWGFHSPPTLTRPRHNTPRPFRRVQKGTEGVPGDGSKFTAAPADPKEYVDPPEEKGSQTVETAGPVKLNKLEDAFKPLEDLEKIATHIPELDHISVALANRLDQNELTCRIEAIDICFDMLQDEFNKLKTLVFKE